MSNTFLFMMSELDQGAARRSRHSTSATDGLLRFIRPPPSVFLCLQAWPWAVGRAVEASNNSAGRKPPCGFLREGECHHLGCYAWRESQLEVYYCCCCKSSPSRLLRFSARCSIIPGGVFIVVRPPLMSPQTGNQTTTTRQEAKFSRCPHHLSRRFVPLLAWYLLR